MGFEFELFSDTPYAVIFDIAVLLLYIFTAVVEWRLLTKAGEKGWKSLIPFYNVYISHEIAGMHHLWFIAEMFVWTAEVLLEALPGIPHWIENPATAVTLLFTIISESIHLCLLSDRFGKGTSFKAGIILLPLVFSAYLAFSSLPYHKPEKKAH